MPPQRYRVTTWEDLSQPCGSNTCVQLVDLVVSIGDSEDRWFWCVEHWPVLHRMLLSRGHTVEVTDQARQAIAHARKTNRLKLIDGEADDKDA